MKFAWLNFDQFLSKMLGLFVGVLQKISVAIKNLVGDQILLL